MLCYALEGTDGEGRVGDGLLPIGGTETETGGGVGH